MVPVEGHERRERHPSVAQFFICVANCENRIINQILAKRIKKGLAESTSVCADIRNLEYLELENTLNIEVYVLPFAEVVTQLATNYLVFAAIAK
jgi:hypothetical protein